MCRGINNNMEGVLDGIFNDFNSGNGDLLSENESKDRPVRGDFDNQALLPQKRAEKN